MKMTNRLQICDKYTEIFLKHTTDTGKTELLQMTHKPKTDIKPLNQKLYTLPLRLHAWIRLELREIEKKTIKSPSTLNL